MTTGRRSTLTDGCSPQRHSPVAAAAWPALLAGLLATQPGPAAGQADACPARPATDAQTPASADEWLAAASRERICVYTRNASASRIRDVLAVAEVEAAPAFVFDAIADYANYPRFMPYVTTSEVLKTEGRMQWVFQQLSLPFPVSNRYYTIRLFADSSQAARAVYRVTWTLAVPGEPQRQGDGEATQVDDGFWDLQPSAAGAATRVTYFIHTDPGGALPAFVANLANTVAVPLVVEKLRARVTAGRTSPP